MFDDLPDWINARKRRKAEREQQEEKSRLEKAARLGHQQFLKFLRNYLNERKHT